MVQPPIHFKPVIAVGSRFVRWAKENPAGADVFIPIEDAVVVPFPPRKMIENVRFVGIVCQVRGRRSIGLDRVNEVTQSDLFQITRALCSSALLFRSFHGRQQHGNQQSDNRYDNEQLYEGETWALACHKFAS